MSFTEALKISEPHGHGIFPHCLINHQYKVLIRFIPEEGRFEMTKYGIGLPPEVRYTEVKETTDQQIDIYYSKLVSGMKKVFRRNDPGFWQGFLQSISEQPGHSRPPVFPF